MNDNVAATVGDEAEPGHSAGSVQSGELGDAVNPALAGDDESQTGAPEEQGTGTADRSENTAGPGEDDHALPQVPYGAWPSPITAAEVAGGRIRVAHPTIIGNTTWWQEDRPDEGGRTTIVRSGLDGKLTTLLPGPWTARTRVHEYGGR
ncbi:MAG: hypothetical protein LBV34_26420, partial [Nocardiopsaceae bacterium]|nr:hypothetical protein [Nocardiopsaceae bacterium]